MFLFTITSFHNQFGILSSHVLNVEIVVVGRFGVEESFDVGVLWQFSVTQRKDSLYVRDGTVVLTAGFTFFHGGFARFPHGARQFRTGGAHQRIGKSVRFALLLPFQDFFARGAGDGGGGACRSGGGQEECCSE